ncbi:MAG: alginate export family protein [Acidobacteriota bacterium]
MKRFVYLGVLALSAGLLATPALAQRGQGEKGRFTLHGEVRVRGEFQSNVMDFFDETATGGPNDDDFDLFPYRVRSPSDPFLQSFRGSFGTQETILYQGYIDVKNVGDSAASFRIGRQEHTLANELMLGDLDFYNGISFDGFRANFDFAQWDLDAFYYVILEGSALDSTLSGATIGADNDVAFTGLDADFTFGDHGTHIRPYILFLDDGGSGITTGIGRPAMQVYTFGGQWGREVNSVEDVDDSPLDWSAEAAIQSGDFDTTSILGPMVQDVSGFIVEGWIGFNWNHGHHSRSRVHAGILIASGDDDPTDGDYDAFIPMFPDTHSRNRLGNLDLFGEPFSTAFGGGIPNNTPVVIGPAGPGNLSNLSNITDVSFGYEVWGEDPLSAGVSPQLHPQRGGLPGQRAARLRRRYPRGQHRQ